MSFSDPFSNSLSINSDISDQRDQRWLSGGNFFGTEAVAPPPLEPLPIDAIKAEAEAAAKAAEAAARGASGPGPVPAPPIMLKLPNAKKNKSPQ